MGFSDSFGGKEPTCNVGDLGSIPGMELSPGEGNDNPLQYSCWENPKDRSLVGYIGLQRVNYGLVTEHSLSVLEKL